MKLKPLADRVVLKPIEEISKTKSGLYIPDTAKEKSHMGEVLAVGPGKVHDGKLLDMSVRVGDKVLYKEYAGEEIKIDSEKVIIIDEKDILGVIA